MKREVHILVGVPASGKSTYVDALLRANIDADMAGPNLKIEVLSSDNYIEEKAKAEGKTYNEVFQKYAGDASKHVMIRARQLANDEETQVVIIDRTNLTKKSRKAFIDIFKDTHVISALIFPTPDREEHERRLASRPGKNIPEFVLKNMRESYERPEVEEGFEVVWYKQD